MRPYLLLVSSLLAGGLAACSAEPSLQYHLTPEQLAWQGYQAGQVLRFGNRRTAAVRTYQVVQVNDELIDGGKSGSLLPWAPKAAYRFQSICALLQRTDTASQQFTAVQLSPNLIGVGDPSRASCLVNWPGLPIEAVLPVDELNQGVPLDTLQYGAVVLPAATFGPATYAQVVQLTRRHYQGSGPGMTIYYAKGQGVVAFAEQKTGLWYRLP